MRKLAWFSFSFGGAAALYVALLNGFWGFFLGLLCAAVFAARLLRHKGWSPIALMTLGLAVGLLWSAAYDLWVMAPVRALDGKTVSFTALLRDDLQPTDHGSMVYADAEIDGHSCRLLLYLEDMPDARAGDRVNATAQLRLPDGEEYDLYYRSLGVDLIAYARPGETVLPADRITLQSMPLLLRRAVKDMLGKLYPADTEPFVRALIIGDRSGLTFSQKNAMSVSGIAHTVAISGMHIAVLMGLVMLLCGNRPGLCAAIGIPIILVFSLMVGAVPSVVRAAVMQIILLLAPLLRRENDPPTSLGAAMLISLMANPWTVANLSFQLSFASMAGILLLSGKVNRRLSAPAFLQNMLRLPVLRQLTKYVTSTVASTMGAVSFTIPLIAWQFSNVSLMSVVTNLLTLWAVTLVFQGSLIACLLGIFWMWPAKLLAGLLSILVRYILGVAALITGLPVAAVYTDNVYIILWLAFAYVLLVAFFLAGKKRPLSYGCVGVMSLCLCVFLGYFDRTGTELRMTMLDVGQGQCLVFQEDGATILYDCGGDSAAQAGETASRFLLSQGIGKVDVLVLSHYDVDHAGGVCQLMERTPVDLLYLPDIPCETDMRQEIEETAAQYQTEIRYVRQNTLLSIGDTQVQIYAPVTNAKANDASLALLYSQGSYDILATGDMSSSAERMLLTENRLPNIEILVVGHHGAKTSTCDTLLEETRPEVVLISAGKNNIYGHPAEETLRRIENFGAQIVRTDLCGNITVRR